jgi:hypothetical protein
LPAVNPRPHFGCNVPHQGRIAPPDDVGVADEVVGEIVDGNMRGVDVVIPRVGPQICDAKPFRLIEVWRKAIQVDGVKRFGGSKWRALV